MFSTANVMKTAGPAYGNLSGAGGTAPGEASPSPFAAGLALGTVPPAGYLQSLRPDSAWSKTQSECNISELGGDGDGVADDDLESLAGSVASKTRSKQKKHVPVILGEDQDNLQCALCGTHILTKTPCNRDAAYGDFFRGQDMRMLRRMT